MLYPISSLDHSWSKSRVHAVEIHMYTLSRFTCSHVHMYTCFIVWPMANKQCHRVQVVEIHWHLLCYHVNETIFFCSLVSISIRPLKHYTYIYIYIYLHLNLIEIISLFEFRLLLLRFEVITSYHHIHQRYHDSVRGLYCLPPLALFRLSPLVLHDRHKCSTTPDAFLAPGSLSFS